MKRQDLPPQAPPLPPSLSVHSSPAVVNSSPAFARREVVSEFELDRVWVVFGLALASLVVIVISLAPVFRAWTLLDDPLTTSWDRWIYLLLFLAMLQLAYIIHLVQLPTGFGLRVCAVASVVTAGFYSMGLAFFSFASLESLWVTWLDLADAHQRGIAAIWCLLMLCLYLPLTFYQGKVAGDWCREERRRRV